MTTITRPATCAAQFPALDGAPRPLCDRLPHKDRFHVACVGEASFAWSDPEDNPLAEWDQAVNAAVRDVYAGEPAEGRTDGLTSLVDAAEVLVAYWRTRPGGTERFDPRIRALIAAYDQLGAPHGAEVPA